MKLTINVIMMLLLFVCSATISAQTNEKGYMVAGTVMDEIIKRRKGGNDYRCLDHCRQRPFERNCNRSGR
mgnify:CR=1 FL=1